MKNTILLITAITIAACTQAQIPNKEEQIAGAVANSEVPECRFAMKVFQVVKISYIINNTHDR